MRKSLITIIGAGPGVSAGIARHFGGKGFRVVLMARNSASLDQQVMDLHRQGIEAHAIVADVSDEERLSAAFAQMDSEYGPPDVLVYNAGANTICNPSELTDEDLLNDYTVNVLGALRSARQVIPGMTERGTGTILFTGGMLALKPVASRASASMSKAGLRVLALTLFDELAPLGVTVGIVTIGGVVQPGTYFDPDLIAESYWELFSGSKQREILYTQDDSA